MLASLTFSLLILGALTPPTVDPEDVAKALEFQAQENKNTSPQADAEASESKRTSPTISKSAPKDQIQRDQKAYREALKDVQAENWNEALISMEAFVRGFATSELADNALYWMAQIYIEKGEFELARTELNRLLKSYPNGDRAKRARARLKSLPELRVERRNHFNSDLKSDLANQSHALDEQEIKEGL